MTSTAFVLQCFIKVDTLQDACESLLKCSSIEVIDLIFWCDSPINSRKEDLYSSLANDVKIYLDNFIESNGYRFRSVECITNKENMGTCKTCELAMTYAMNTHDFVIFAEDDVILSMDTIEWFENIRNSDDFNDKNCWAIAGESIFFNGEQRDVSEAWAGKMFDLAVSENLITFYTSHNFVPSTCFATTSEKWSEFGETRGQALGDVDVCNRCQQEGKFAVFPIVPRVKDVGMLHENGYSVSIHSVSGVSEVKNTYFTSDSIVEIYKRQKTNLQRYGGDLGRLFTLSTLLRSVG